MTEENKIEMKMLESKLLTNNIVKFQLEDGTTVSIKVEIARAGIAINFKNPDGSPHYEIQFANAIQVIPKDKKFYIPRPTIFDKDKKQDKSYVQ